MLDPKEPTSENYNGYLKAATTHAPLEGFSIFIRAPSGLNGERYAKTVPERVRQALGLGGHDRNLHR